MPIKFSNPLLENISGNIHTPEQTEIIDRCIKNADYKNFSYPETRKLLELASLYDYPQVIRFLAQNNVDLNIAFRGGFTALHLAAANDQIMATQVLLEEGASITRKDNHGRTAFELAEENGALGAASLISDALKKLVITTKHVKIIEKKDISFNSNPQNDLRSFSEKLREIKSKKLINKCSLTSSTIRGA